jgi:hypothetical protein
MGKKGTGGGKRTGGGEGSTENWTSADHAIRMAKKQRRNTSISEDKAAERARRSALLTRDSRQKREEGKLRLHIKRAQRQLDKLRGRLKAWDDVEERRLEQERLEKERKEQEAAAAGPKKRTGRKGPETWKLKGAARPAYMVYDFDTRYVDPHLKAHADAKIKATRIRNIFSLYKGRFGDEGSADVPQPYCREFLALLMQLGNLSLQQNHLKTAREAFLECMELESSDPPTTPARCQLMKIYLEANRPESARRLWEKLSPDDPSVWIRYSSALIEFVSWRVLEESGSTEESARALLVTAIQTNIYCAYYLAFWESFQNAMDYTDEIEDATDEHPLEEAIEYCNSEQGYGAWRGTEGALEWIQEVVISTLKGNSNGVLSFKDLEWKDKLKAIKEEYEANAKLEDDADEDDDSKSAGEDEEHSDDEEETKVDGAMFAGMFETAMEMLEDSGDLKGLRTS